MQDVAQDPQFARVSQLQEARQPVQVVMCATGRQADPGAPEHIGLAQVQVGDQQAASRRPVQGAIGQQLHRLASQFGAMASRHISSPAVAPRAAPASSSPPC